jgi:pimeloyl-ACP methyl ester carboxylesterase
MTLELDRRMLIGAAALSLAACTPGEEKAVTKTSAAAPVTGRAPSKGLDIYYEVHGGDPKSKVPYVLLHGGVMAIDTAFKGGLLERLAALRPVIAIEQQGHGHTADRPGDVISYDQMVDDTAAVLAHLGVPKAHFVGHSMGGMISLGMAVRHPEMVATLTPISAMQNLDGFLADLAAQQRDPNHVPKPETAALFPTEQDFASWKAHYEKVNPDPKTFDAVVPKLNKMLAAWPGFTNAQFAAIKAPALVMIGDNDFTRLEHAVEMKRRIPGANLAILPNATHMNITRKGDLLVPMIEENAARAV